MYAACKVLGLKEADEVLTPAFDCDGSLQPFRIIGCKLIFFRSDPYTFNVDINDIRSKITPKTRLIHIINHFGLPQPWDEIMAFRTETGIPILEDNAYSLFSGFGGKPLGAFGDMSVFSLRKELPLISAGMLRVNNPAYAFSLFERQAQIIRFAELAGLFKKACLWIKYHKLGRSIKPLLKLFSLKQKIPPPLYSDKNGWPEYPLRDKIGREFSCDYLRPVSGAAIEQLSHYSQDEYTLIMQKRRHYYAFLVKELSGVRGLEVLWPELPAGVVPFCLSILVHSQRDIFLENLRSKYEVMAWPTYPLEVLENLEDFPEIQILGRKLLQINLPADAVRMSFFNAYLRDLLSDLRKLANRIPYVVST